MTEEEAVTALKGTDRTLAATAEAVLWSHWCRSGNSAADAHFRAGVEAMQKNDLSEAETQFSRVIDLVPEFAEGWNKRATVRYMAKNFDASIADCRETVARNPNHFAAFSGQGLCHMSLEQFDEAAICFRRALEINPHMTAVRQNLTLATSQGSGGGGYLH
ncbi:MAG: tetratricopeptide repeat protein [Deltaproteobacteria bacterium]|nr:tetratricopeptide repeat protein [Deltaproteobacteria bacterium]